MTKTTIELPESTKEKLRQERLDHETNYGQTIERLLDNHEVPYITESEARSIVSEMVVLEALE
jgi:hypothetical protein